MDYPNCISERIIPLASTILQSLKKMDEVNKKLLLVFDNDRFIGVLSIGDIQKAIISNISLDTAIEKIMRSDYVYAKISETKEDVLNLMKLHRIECMPLVNDDNQLVTAYFWEDIFGSSRKTSIKLDLPVVIMAGGMGSRLRPLTHVIPKPLIPIGEKTVIENIIDRFSISGCKTFYVSINYKAEMIKYYFSTLPIGDNQIHFLEENKPLGTAGSIHLLQGKINSTFFVSNCDIIIDQDIADIAEYHRNNKNEITVVAALKHYFIPYGILETGDNGILKSITEKPELTFKINTGLYVLEPQLIEEIPKNQHYHITSLIGKLLNQKRNVGVFPVSQKSWRDIGEWAEYKKVFNQ